MGAIMRFCLLIISFVLVTAGSLVLASESYPIYVYHEEAPYQIKQQADLSHHWVQFINQQQDAFKLTLTYINRSKLNGLVESGQPYLILWANSLWFKFRDASLLSSVAIFWDADTLVSSVETPYDLKDFSTLTGLTIGTRKGHFYANLEPMFKAKTIKRADSTSSLINYQKLFDGKIDGFLDSRSSILYTKKQLKNSTKLHISSNPQDAYSRNVLLSKHYAWLLPALNKAISEMQQDANWQDELNRWGLQELINPFELDLNELNQL